MRHLKKILALAVLAWMAAACAEESAPDASPQEQRAYTSDKLSLKLKPRIVDRIDNRKKWLTPPTGSDELDDFLRGAGASRICRIFPYAGKDEDKQQREELNCWYTVIIDQSLSATTRGALTRTLDEIASYVEPVAVPRLEETKYILVDEPQAASTRSRFDDPLYTDQWNFRNTGAVGAYTDALDNQTTSSIAGADINIEPAWSLSTGDPDVIVAIVDGGIDTAHPDLKESLWTNPGEIPGNGIDDDNNGYVDDCHGYNFVDDNGTILPTEHGSHVAGVIAARNNNGTGVCGIAGGNGAPGTGARLMSCQIFRKNPDYNPRDPRSREDIGTGDLNQTAAAIVYGANNGALISQNSWGFDLDVRSTPRVIKEAIDYFEKYAGGSKTRRPLMKGGVVVFAASNDATAQPTYPAAEDNVISVAAWNPDFQPSWYTNYGETVDIAAPGGSYPDRGKYPSEGGLPTSAVLSTVSTDADGRGRYGYMQGTSMACPHISGIAALIVSKYGNASFTSEDLRRRILAGVKRMDYNDYVTDRYFDGMGLGYADALAALTDDANAAAPSAPEFVKEEGSSGYGDVTVAWKSGNKGSDGSLQSYMLYSSLTPITASNFHQASVHRINASYAEAGKIFRRTYSSGKSNTTYYFAVQAVARNGKTSPATILEGGISTLNNEPPKIEADMAGNRLTLAGKDTRTVRFTVTDKENHQWTYSFSNAGALSIVRTQNVLTVRINADSFIPGIYQLRLTVTDEYGAKSTFNLTLEILADKAPSLKKGFGMLNVKKGREKSVALSDIIDDEQPSGIDCIVSSGGQASAYVKDGTLSVKGLEWGEGYVEISATDVHKQTGVFRIPVFVYEDEGIYALYPTVATAVVYVRLGEAVEGDVEMTVRNAAGKQALRKTFHTSSLNAVQRTYRLDVQKLSPGSYTLSVINRSKTYQSRFIKDKR